MSIIKPKSDFPGWRKNHQENQDKMSSKGDAGIYFGITPKRHGQKNDRKQVTRDSIYWKGSGR